MINIDELISRYLAEGLSPEELAALSEAVHRDDASEEWRVVRDMIDSLGDGEDDYDLYIAARTAVPKRLRLRSTWVWRVAAAVVLVAGVGVSLYYYRGVVPEVAKAVTDTIKQPARQQIAEAKADVTIPVAAPSAETVAAEAVAAEASEPASTDRKPVVRESVKGVATPQERPAHSSAYTPESTPQIAAAEQLAEVSVEQRRIFSQNLLDEVPE